MPGCNTSSAEDSRQTHAAACRRETRRDEFKGCGSPDAGRTYSRAHYRN